MQLYIGNLALDVDEAMLKELFSNFSTLVSINVVRSRVDTISRGFAFVDINSTDEAMEIISTFNTIKFHQRTLHVMQARPTNTLPSDTW